MSNFFLVFLIAGMAAFLTYLGAPLAERFTVPHRLVSGEQNFAGILCVGGMSVYALMSLTIK